MRLWRTAAPLYWCEVCGVPLLEPKCGSCEEPAVNLHASPPKEVRPSFEKDLNLIRTVVAEEAGERASYALVPNDRLVLLNKAAYIDQADEVVVDGVPLGLLYFNPELLKWRFKLAAEGAALLWNEREGYYAQLRKEVKVEKWKVLTRSDVKSGELPSCIGKYVYLVSSLERPVGLAVWLNEGLKVVKVWKGLKDGVVRVRASWSKALKGNGEALERVEARSRAFIRKVAEGYVGPKVVSFSGGKDSLACLLLCLKELGRSTLLFNDTGLEMPETVKHVEEVADRFDLELLKADAEEAFWSSLDLFGPPARDYRWCCKVCKLIPIARLIKKVYSGGHLSFLGQRRYESFARARAPSLSRSWWVKGSMRASPINDWSSLHVWLYLFKEGAHFNPLYKEGFDRIGCWLCPSCELAEFKLVEKLHPEAWEAWHKWLKSWAGARGLASSWVDYGLWRWRKLPGDQAKLAKRLKIEDSIKLLNEKPRSSFNILTIGRKSLCTQEPLLEFYISPIPKLETVENLAVTLSRVKVVKAGKTLLLKSLRWSAILRDDGKLRFKAYSMEDLAEGSGGLMRVLARSVFCNRCGSCKVNCPKECIKIDGWVGVEGSKCRGCSICNRVCPIATYLAKTPLLEWEAG